MRRRISTPDHPIESVLTSSSQGSNPGAPGVEEAEDEVPLAGTISASCVGDIIVGKAIVGRARGIGGADGGTSK